MISHHSALLGSRFRHVVYMLCAGDPYGHVQTQHKANVRVFPNRSHLWYGCCILRALAADIIIMHDPEHNYPIPPWFRCKPVIVYWHGTTLRTSSLEQRQKWERLARAILVSTPDLLEQPTQKPSRLLPAAIDTNHFKRHPPGDPNRGFCRLKRGQDPKHTMNIISDMGYGDSITWDMLPYYAGIPHVDMPTRMADYGWYADINIINGTVTHSNSLMGIQAACVGCKVLTSTGDILEHVPKDRHAESVIPKLDAILQNVLTPRGDHC